MDYETIGKQCDTIVKVSVFCLSSLRNEVKKLFYVQFFTNPPTNQKDSFLRSGGICILNLSFLCLKK